MRYLIYLCICSLLCHCTPCTESRGIEGAGLTIDFFDKAANQYFYPENKSLSPFNIDSLKVIDSRGNRLTTPYQLNQSTLNPVERFYVTSIYPIFIPQQDTAAFRVEQTKDIFIRYNHNTYDTIRLVYKAKKLKCINAFEYLRAYHRGVLLAEGDRPSGLVFKLNH